MAAPLQGERSGGGALTPLGGPGGLLEPLPCEALDAGPTQPKAAGAWGMPCSPTA